MTTSRLPQLRTPPITQDGLTYAAHVVSSNVVQGLASNIVYKVYVNFPMGPIVLPDVVAHGEHLYGDDVDVYAAPPDTEIVVKDISGMLHYMIHEHEAPVLTDCGDTP